MKRILFYAATMLLACTTTNSFAQSIKIPPLSTSQTIEQELGLGQITLTYARPNIRGRKIFGKLVPYGEVWRLGANSATIIKFSDDVTLEGNKVPAGEYGFFAIPGENEWTIILNKNAHQWGAYTYKEADDFLRFKVKNVHHDAPLETMTMWFGNVDQTKGELEMRWDKEGFLLHVSTDVDTKVMANIDQVMNKDQKPYFTAALYYYQNGKDLKQALEWITTAEKSSPKSAFYKVWKARIQLKMGDKAGALATAQEGIKLAHDQKDAEYEGLNQAVADQAKS
jgi:tetratricopeptide (TPR) repeat protein